MTTAEDPRPAVPPSAPPNQARVVVADDHPLYRAGVVRALQETGRFAVVGEAADGERALELILRHLPNLAVVDVRMPQLDGLALLARLTAERAQVPVLMLSAFTDPELVERALAAGAAAYVSKESDRDELVAAATAIVLGARVLPAAPRELERPQLLPPERVILSLLRDGWSLGDVPHIMDLDRANAERYARDAAARLGVDRPEDAVASALAWGLLE